MGVLTHTVCVTSVLPVKPIMAVTIGITEFLANTVCGRVLANVCGDYLSVLALIPVFAMLWRIYLILFSFSFSSN